MRVFNNYLVLLLMIFAGAQTAAAQNYYRSIASGNWSNLSTWQNSPDNITWSAALAAPSSTDLSITIQSPNTVTINSNITIDEVSVNLGASLTLTGAITATINQGVGTDLVINGTLTDNLTAVGGSVVFNAGAKWSMSSGASIIKTSGSANNTWQQNYQGGIATIPPTANWILRKTGASNPPISTTITGGAYYPNLIIENNTASQWVTAAGSTFNGAAGYPTIKGNFDVGGSGTNTVDFLNAHSNPTPTRILGNLFIRAGNVFRNQGTGIEIDGNLTVDGTLNYSGTSKVLFAGANAQTIVTAPGSISIYNLEINKPANDVTVNKAFTVDNNGNFIQGRFFTTITYPITFGDLATATGYNNTSFISGPCLKTGTAGFTFPVGKVSNVQPIGMGTGAVGLPPPFWIENFNTGAGWSLVNVLGGEGADPNFFQITDDEGGITPPGCGVANNGNKTLHVTSVFFPGGGAAYDAGGLCGFWFCPQTNRRAESPLINCTGKSNITLSFNYIGNGQGLTDNASLWYYNGSAWSVLNTSLKSAVCGSGQGQWTAYSVLLPASANNNPGIKIGFKWENNDDGVGTDPSFAVDDISLSVVSSDIFSAEYFPVNPQTLFGSNLEATLDHISYCEYWDLTRLSGSSNRQVTLTWDNFSCGVTSLNDLRVARYDAGANIWRDHGNNVGLLTGNTSAGTITSSLISSVYCPYTLASVNDLNPLPVSLLSFEVKSEGNHVNINWATSNEISNRFFTVEKSKTLNDVTVVSTVAAKGSAVNGANYFETDYKPFDGSSYYRLKQTDVNGLCTYTNWKQVMFSAHAEQALNIVSNSNSVNFTITPFILNSDAYVKIFNSIGAVVFNQPMKIKETNRLDTYYLPTGIYILSVEVNGSTLSEKFQY